MPDNNPIGAVLVDSDYQEMLGEGRLTLPQKKLVANEVVQPDSLDLYIGDNPIYKVNGIPDLSEGFDPKTFIERYQRGPVYKTSRIGKPADLERLGVYITKLDHTVHLNNDENAFANARSSVGRTDILCMLLGEGCTQFNVLPDGYKGKLWLVIVPQSFSINLIQFTSLIQLRVYRGQRRLLDDTQLRILHKSGKLICNTGPSLIEPIIHNGKLLVRLDLSGTPSNLVSGDSNEPILIQSGTSIDPRKFFLEKHLDKHGCFG